jgi:hypothetical protein
MDVEWVRGILAEYRETLGVEFGPDTGGWCIVEDGWAYAEERRPGSVGRFLAKLRAAVAEGVDGGLTEPERADLARLTAALEKEWEVFGPMILHDAACNFYNLPGLSSAKPDAFRGN